MTKTYINKNFTIDTISLTNQISMFLNHTKHTDEDTNTIINNVESVLDSTNKTVNIKKL